VEALIARCRSKIIDALDAIAYIHNHRLEGILTKILVLDMYKALSIHKIRQKYRHYTRHYT
jgi:hypothetical protein